MQPGWFLAVLPLPVAMPIDAQHQPQKSIFCVYSQNSAIGR
jgi:hypothetical protein